MCQRNNLSLCLYVEKVISLQFLFTKFNLSQFSFNTIFEDFSTNHIRGLK